MTRFEINLIEERVIPLWKRRLMLAGMRLYILACMALLAMAIAGLVTECEKGRDLYRQMALTERSFREAHPDQSQFLVYMAGLRDRVKARTEQLDAVQGILGKRVDPVCILLKLAGTLPPAASISSLEIDPGRGTLSFDLTVPVEESGYAFSSSAVLDRCNADSVLMREVSEIRAGATMRQRVDGRTVFVVKFSGQLRRAAA